MTETTIVHVTVLDLMRVNGPGKLVALANAEIEIDGVGIGLQGIRVLDFNGMTKVEPPQFRDLDGRWCPAVVLPEAVGRELARQADAARRPCITL